ncbi:RNA polymerase sigma-70 factor [Pedobacter sp. B4-66]|uniref:RNA polymerase sigma factor n=1 Tax=Pedobacter sp. B4-66 TaxID=2817280 RepID=UPI001BD9225A|nr:RNA polymerase sigma-70 factor [Pedobacter sp. B4-66]
MTDCRTLSDAQLVDLLKAGDHHSFTEIYKRYNSLLYIYAYKKLQDNESAKDIIQEIYTHLWNSRSNLNIQTTLSGYLYKAVLNRVLNVFRHVAITQEYISSFKEVIDNAPAQTDYRIREKDLKSLIEKEINNLPEKMREIFQLRRQEYLSNKEIADRLNISEHTVATQIKRALKTLRGKLGLLLFIYAFLTGMLK